MFGSLGLEYLNVRRRQPIGLLHVRLEAPISQYCRQFPWLLLSGRDLIYGIAFKVNIQTDLKKERKKNDRQILFEQIRELK
jgi:hypothetical protein